MKHRGVFKRFVISFLCFIAYIFAFAAHYTFVLSDDFRFEGIVHEKAYQITKERIENRYLEALRDNKVGLEDSISSAAKILNRPDLRHVQIFLSLENWKPGELSFKGSMLFLNAEDFERFQRIDECVSVEDHGVQLVPDCILFHGNLDEETTVRVSMNDCWAETRSPWGLARFIHCQGYIGQNTLRTSIHEPLLYVAADVSEEVAKEADAFTRAQTQLQEGRFLRMLYLSAVTATTLGYGDIIPLTTVARLSVALQSLLGLFLMGFFVYYVTKRE